VKQCFPDKAFTISRYTVLFRYLTETGNGTKIFTMKAANNYVWKDGKIYLLLYSYHCATIILFGGYLWTRKSNIELMDVFKKRKNKITRSLSLNLQNLQLLHDGGKFTAIAITSAWNRPSCGTKERKREEAERKLNLSPWHVWQRSWNLQHQCFTIMDFPGERPPSIE